MEPKTGKRIVRKEAYVTRLANLFGLALVTVLCGFIAFSYGTEVVLSAYEFLASVIYEPQWKHGLLALENLVLFLVLTVCFWKLSRYSHKKYTHLDSGVSLTRANTGDLPAPDTLVRASSEPLRVQEAVLLRAAEEMGTPPEQLVRASVGGKSEG